MDISKLLEQPGIAMGLDKLISLNTEHYQSYVTLEEYVGNALAMGINIAYASNHDQDLVEDLLFAYQKYQEQVANGDLGLPTFSEKELLNLIKSLEYSYDYNTERVLTNNKVSVPGMTVQEVIKKLDDITICDVEDPLRQPRSQIISADAQKRSFSKKSILDGSKVLIEGVSKDGVYVSKYILGLDVETEKFLGVVATNEVEYHKYIGSRYGYKPLGGGHIELYKNNILVWGQSGDFGYEPRLVTGILLSEAFPESDIQLSW